MTRSPLAFLGLLALALTLAAPAFARPQPFALPVDPPEHKTMRDPVTGTELLFVTTHPAPDHNLYFHERSWISDESMLLFTSERPHGGPMGYLFATGELVRLTTPSGNISAGTITASRYGNRVYGARGKDIIELSLKIEPSGDPGVRSRVTATDRVICRLGPEESLCCSLNENCTGRLLGLGINAPGGQRVDVVDVRTGKRRTVCTYNYAGHLQWSRTNPSLLSVAGLRNRLVVIDLAAGGVPREIHHQVPGEYVTHESWWANDLMLFCGGFRDKESQVKSINPRTGEVRIVGTGAWVPWTPDGDDVLNRWNWWHAAGHESGRWIAADNWWGDIVIFDGKTGQPHRLTLRHSKYGGGKHPEVGWDRSGRRVVFRSQMLGGIDVCVATLPERWADQDPLDAGDLVITGGRTREELDRAGIPIGQPPEK